jgi:MFS family permease
MSEGINPGFRWLVLVTMFVVTAITSVFLIAPAPLLAEIMKTMPQLSPVRAIFIIMAIFNIFVGVAVVLGGPLLDKFGVMKVYM